MIMRLKGKNFQSHLDTTVDFVPTLNIITGGTDSGKSTLLRMIQWVTSGKPSGFDFISHQACKHGGFVEVSIDFDDCFVSRYKTKSKNTWNVNGLKLSATGRNVPDEAVGLLNWNEINYCSQLEPYFLLSDSRGQVAKKMNSIVDLEIIDDSMAKISKDMRAVSTDIKYMDGEVERIDKELEKYSFLDEAIKLDSEIIKDKLNIVKTTNNLDLLIKETCKLISINHFDFDSMLLTIEKLISVEKDISTLHDYPIDVEDFDFDAYSIIVESISELSKDINSLSSYPAVTDSLASSALDSVNDLICDYSCVENLSDSIASLQSITSQLRYVSIDIPDITHMELINKSIVEKEEEINNVSLIFSNMCDISSEIKKSAQYINEQEMKFKNIIGDECPLCGK